MPSRSAFDYAVLRVVPDIERGEFLNAGIILFSRPRRFLEARIELDRDALERLRPGGDAAGVETQLRFIESLAAGTLGIEPFGRMSQSERFAWLTTPRSTVVQPGPIHAGTTDDPAATLAHLFDTLVRR